jgi:hypothetical protein
MIFYDKIILKINDKHENFNNEIQAFFTCCTCNSYNITEASEYWTSSNCFIHNTFHEVNKIHETIYNIIDNRLRKIFWVPSQTSIELTDTKKEHTHQLTRLLSVKL